MTHLACLDGPAWASQEAGPCRGAAASMSEVPGVQGAAVSIQLSPRQVRRPQLLSSLVLALTGVGGGRGNVVHP